MQTTQNPEVEHSQVKRQENEQQIQERNFEICNSRTMRHDKDLTFSAEEVGNYSTFSKAALKTKCIGLGNVYDCIDESRHSSWTELFGELGSLQEHEFRGNSELTIRAKSITCSPFFSQQLISYCITVGVAARNYFPITVTAAVAARNYFPIPVTAAVAVRKDRK